MSTTGEATVNPDGTTTTQTTPPEEPPQQQSSEESEQQYAGQQEQNQQDQQEQFQQEIPNEQLKRTGTDPAIYLALSFIAFVVLYVLHYKRQKKKQMDREAFFFDMDGDKFNIQLPKAVDEYYEVKEKCIKAGWEPGKVSILFCFFCFVKGDIFAVCDSFMLIS